MTLGWGSLRVRWWPTHLLVIAVIATSCGTAGTIRASGPLVPVLEWSKCRANDVGKSNANQELDGAECATLKVPVDYDAPSSSIQISMVRMKAQGKASERVGSLFLNPGGPGASGIDFFYGIVETLPHELLDKFDIVSFDPRGMGHSSPLDCLTEAERAEADHHKVPDDPAQARQEAEAFEQKIANGCKADDPALLEHMGTYDVVRDLDVMRRAVGDDKLNYLGISYGTYIGAMYASTFPESTRALVLDSPVTPSQDNVKPGLDQLKGFDASIQSWYADCRSKPSCPLNPDPKLRVQQARASLKATPIDVEIEGKKRRFELSDLDSALFEIQYGPFAYDPANEAIAALSGTDTARKTLAVSFLLNLADELDMKQDDGTYGNAQEANFVVVCADSAAPSTEAEVQTIINEIAGLDPIISDDAQDITADCQFLPTGGNKGAISRSSAADHVLITASRGDPATPYAWAQELADALGVNSYTTYDGPGHANLLDNSCLLDAAVGFFVSLHSAPAQCPKVPGTTSFGRFMATQFAKEDSDTDTVNDAYVNCLAPGLESLDQLALAAPVTDSMSSSIEDEITALVINCSSGR